jgi:DNA-binding NtrC family response regulator
MPLAEHFLLRYAEKYAKPLRAISQAAYSLMARYDWPGNVRELESVIEHGVLFSRDEELMPEDLPEQLHAAQSQHYRCVIPPYVTMEEIEREAIAQTLERTGGNVKKTAQILDYHRPTLYRKLKKFGLMGADGEGRGHGAA